MPDPYPYRPCRCDRPACASCRWVREHAAGIKDIPIVRRWAGEPHPDAPPPPPPGVGEHLKLLIASFGVGSWSGCGCDATAAEMDAAGPVGVRAKLDHYAGVLREKARQLGWWAKLIAGGRAAIAGLILSPRDPYPGLIEEACRRAEAAAAPRP